MKETQKRAGTFNNRGIYFTIIIGKTGKGDKEQITTEFISMYNNAST